MVLASQPKHKLTAHDKKRHGQHHKQSKHYSKTYWPYLPMLLIVVCGFIINTTWNAGKGVLSYATEMSASALLAETNIQRSQNSKNSLTLNALLNQAAQNKANDMAARDYWSHTTPEGKQPWQFISDVGYTYIAAGENLAYGFDTSAYTVSGWMNSPPHKENLLNSNYSEVGFGIANSANYQGDGEMTIVVAMYAKPQKIVTPNSATTGRAPETKETTPVAKEETPAPETPVAEETPVEEPTVEEDVVSLPVTTEKDTVLPPAKEVSRIDILTSGNAQWAAIAISSLATIALAWVTIKHARIWRRYLVKGENFVIDHPLFDTVVVAVIVIAVLLMQTGGFIH